MSHVAAVSPASLKPLGLAGAECWAAAAPTHRISDLDDARFTRLITVVPLSLAFRIAAAR
jgi:hypothetical protein